MLIPNPLEVISHEFLVAIFWLLSMIYSVDLFDLKLTDSEFSIKLSIQISFQLIGFAFTLIVCSVFGITFFRAYCLLWLGVYLFMFIGLEILCRRIQIGHWPKVYLSNYIGVIAGVFSIFSYLLVVMALGAISKSFQIIYYPEW